MRVKFVKKILTRKFGTVAKPAKVLPVGVEDFLRLATFYFNSMGVDPYESERKPSIGFQLYLVFHTINLFFVWFSMMVFVVESIGPNADFIKLSTVVGYITFGNVGVLKIIFVHLQKGKLSSLVRHMKLLFPPPIEKEREQYALRHYLKFCNQISRGFASLLMATVTINSMSSLVHYIIQSWWLKTPNAELTLPYVPWAPWNWRGTWRFWPTYLLQSIGNYTCTCGYISADLMMFAAVIQVVMHFDRLARTLREFDVLKRNHSNWKELRSLIAYHNQVLE
ncbi:odorant receptor 67a-like [Drosophila takahashii]|uniref:odorant receptor 67a-like n=1 Tax=Drosophila takahashii TaxID=29030 RepID=UPI001CF8F0A4|nr:odorant receptor 67a-like [Drosophila takahashii]